MKLGEVFQQANIIYREEKEGFYKNVSDIPAYAFAYLVNSIENNNKTRGVTFSSEYGENILESVNSAVREYGRSTRVRKNFLTKLPILDSEKESIDIKNFLIKHQDKVIYHNGYGLSFAYDKCYLKLTLLQTLPNHLDKKMSVQQALAYLEKMIESGRLPYICLKVNTFMGFNVPNMKSTKNGYLFSAYGVNILKDPVCYDHLGDWYEKFGRKAVKPYSLYHVCRCNSNKYRNQWYLIKDKKEEK